MSDVALLVAAAREAGEIALAHRRRGLAVSYKAGHSPVTDGDLAVDAFLTRELRGARPDYGWLSEETRDNPARLAAGRVFVVDPIDGTRSYAAGKPFFTVCAAVVEGGRATAGVVFAPELDECFVAEGGRATRNGQPIAPSAVSRLDACRMLGDANMFRHPSWATPWPDMTVESRNSTAYRLCLVADGRFDATLALVRKADWDLAAAAAVAEAAGALATDHKGRAFAFNSPDPWQPSLVCATPALHPLIVERTAPIDLDRPVSQP